MGIFTQLWIYQGLMKIEQERSQVSSHFLKQPSNAVDKDIMPNQKFGNLFDLSKAVVPFQKSRGPDHPTSHYGTLCGSEVIPPLSRDCPCPGTSSKSYKQNSQLLKMPGFHKLQVKQKYQLWLSFLLVFFVFKVINSIGKAQKKIIFLLIIS